MELTILLIMGIGYLVYRIAFQVPKDIKRTEEKIDMLELQLKEINIELNEISEKLQK